MYHYLLNTAGNHCPIVCLIKSQQLKFIYPYICVIVINIFLLLLHVSWWATFKWHFFYCKSDYGKSNKSIKCKTFHFHNTHSHVCDFFDYNFFFFREVWLLFLKASTVIKSRDTVSLLSILFFLVYITAETKTAHLELLIFFPYLTDP